MDGSDFGLPGEGFRRPANLPAAVARVDFVTRDPQRLQPRTTDKRSDPSYMADPDFIARGRERADVERLGRELTELAGHLNAANYRFLELLAEFDTREGWSGWGVRDCAHWLNFKLGINLGAAREKVRVAHALEELPLIRDAMAQGKLSYCKVRAITRVADRCTEDYFLNIALHGTVHHVEKLVQAFRRSREAEEISREIFQHQHRSLTWYHDDDGSLVMKVRLPAETGAIVLKALEAALPDPKLGEVDLEKLRELPKPSVRQADALGIIAESFLAHGQETLSGGDRHQIVVHVDAETLCHKTSGRCEHEHGPVMAAETARRLACDASLVRVIESAEGEPLDVGRKTRSIPSALRRALQSRDKGCRFPGCTLHRYVDGHHVKHWADGGETKLSNLVLLCRFHHRLVHEGGYTVQILDDGALRFLRPDGRDLNAPLEYETPAQWQALVQAHRSAGLEITHATAETGWRGERMDYGLAVEGLLQRWHRGQHVSAETRGGHLT
jgi:Domain of unknown function (DUF222)/HNH endonuclease